MAATTMWMQPVLSYNLCFIVLMVYIKHNHSQRIFRNNYIFCGHACEGAHQQRNLVGLSDSGGDTLNEYTQLPLRTKSNNAPQSHLRPGKKQRCNRRARQRYYPDYRATLKKIGKESFAMIYVNIVLFAKTTKPDLEIAHKAFNKPLSSSFVTPVRVSRGKTISIVEWCCACACVCVCVCACVCVRKPRSSVQASEVGGLYVDL